MSTPDVMQLLLQSCRGWADRIKRTAYVSDVQVSKGAEGAVVISVRWPATRAQPAGEHRVVITRAKALGRTASAPPLQQRLAKKTCRFRDDIISEILRVRGI